MNSQEVVDHEVKLLLSSQISGFERSRSWRNYRRKNFASAP
jgi:hypothetical protein